MSVLSDKEKLVLEAIVKFFILNANPVASNYVARHSALAFSPATIRNIMYSLEEKGYIYQPHTSAGRVPTTRGYRFYVDHMMRRARLSTGQKETIKKAVFQNPGDFETVLKEASRILAHLSQQLSVIISPEFDEGVFHRMDITRLSSERLLLILSIKSGMVKTILLEVSSYLRDEHLNSLCNILNERLHGLKVREIRAKFREIVQDIADDKSGLIPLFSKAAHKIFDFSGENEVFLTGTHNILRQPEFANSIKVSSVVELLEDKNLVIHLLDDDIPDQKLSIKIGEEIREKKMKNCSIISARYRIGNMSGTLGVIGPIRMDYSYLVPLVDFTANFLSDSLGEN